MRQMVIPSRASTRYSNTQISSFVAEVKSNGFCILRNHFNAEKMSAWKDEFLSILKARIENGTASARGAQRYYVSLPFRPPFADPEVYEDEDILSIVNKLAGGEIVMPELATDTPLQGSEYQVIHRDHPQLSPDLPENEPWRPFQFAVNFSLSKITLDNGPFEIAPGTHLLTDKEARQQIESGEAQRNLVPLLMEPGDVMIRDVRALHRGTPNHTDEPRVMVVVGYNRVEHRRPQLRIHISADVHTRLSDRARQMLRLNPVVDSLEDANFEEKYSNLYFLEEESK